MKKWVDIEFEVGDMVYLKTDKEQCKRVLIGICLRPTGITYNLTCGITDSWHYGFELAKEPDLVEKFKNQES